MALFHIVFGLVGNSEKMKGQKGQRKIAQPAGSSSKRDDITSKLQSLIWCRTLFFARTENFVATPTDKFPIHRGVMSEPGVAGVGWNLFSRSDVDCRRQPWSKGPPAQYTHVVNDLGG